ncbi:MAG: metal-dependent transcriptional regulator [Elusimicrobiota bacterium]
MKKKKRKISSSAEDYLETIYILDKKNDKVRVKDVSKLLNVTMPSVHQAVHKLSERDLIVHENYGGIKLTEKGRKNGKEIYHKHKILTKFLSEILGVDEEIAQEDACRIEHIINKKTLDRLVKFIDFAESYPLQEEPNWLKSFKYFVETGARPRECMEKIGEKQER